jgi:hypothetical protein
MLKTWEFKHNEMEFISSVKIFLYMALASNVLEQEPYLKLRCKSILNYVPQQLYICVNEVST